MQGGRARQSTMRRQTQQLQSQRQQYQQQYQQRYQQHQQSHRYPEQEPALVGVLAAIEVALWCRALVWELLRQIRMCVCVWLRVVAVLVVLVYA